LRNIKLPLTFFIHVTKDLSTLSVIKRNKKALVK